MDGVDKNMQRDTMRIGVGTDSHMSALREAGAENTLTRPQVMSMVDDLPMRNFHFRPGDVIVLAHPSVLSLDLIKMIAAHSVSFEVIGHDPITCSNDAERRALRKMKPVGSPVEVVERRGAVPTYRQPTDAQMETIKALWYSDATRAVILQKVRDMMGEPDLPDTWARDRMKKLTGHTRRKPDTKEEDRE